MEWISVEDDLPVGCIDVWAANDDLQIVEEGISSSLDEKSHWCDFGFEVTHWQPYIVPEAPKKLMTN